MVLDWLSESHDNGNCTEVVIAISRHAGAPTPLLCRHITGVWLGLSMMHSTHSAFWRELMAVNSSSSDWNSHVRLLPPPHHTISMKIAGTLQSVHWASTYVRGDSAAWCMEPTVGAGQS
eukprot:3845535-Amphidinium_carterae.1